jgi:hypothetical protein
MKRNPTTMIKAKFSNEVHKLLEPNINIKGNKRWQNRKAYELTDKQKIEMFDKIVALHKETSSELTSYQFDKREKKRVNNARIERGVVPKTKTSKEDYEKMKATA